MEHKLINIMTAVNSNLSVCMGNLKYLTTGKLTAKATFLTNNHGLVTKWVMGHLEGASTDTECVGVVGLAHLSGGSRPILGIVG